MRQTYLRPNSAAGQQPIGLTGLENAPPSGTLTQLHAELDYISLLTNK